MKRLVTVVAIIAALWIGIITDSTPGRSFNDTFRRRYGELYFINRAGAPPFAYIPKASGPYRGGEARLRAMPAAWLSSSLANIGSHTK